MTNSNNAATPIVAKKIEAILEERKTKTDRREVPDARLPASVERRSGQDRRAKN